jgi:hypothetical protein
VAFEVGCNNCIMYYKYIDLTFIGKFKHFNNTMIVNMPDNHNQFACNWHTHIIWLPALSKTPPSDQRWTCDKINPANYRPFSMTWVKTHRRIKFYKARHVLVNSISFQHRKRSCWGLSNNLIQGQGTDLLLLDFS